MKHLSVFMSALALTLSAIAIYLTLNTGVIENWKLEDTMSISLAFISVCTTLMVASQVYGLNYSKKEVHEAIQLEINKVKKNNETKLSMIAYRNGINNLENKIIFKDWHNAITEIIHLVNILMDIKDIERADTLADMISEAENRYTFSELVHPTYKDALIKNVWLLINFTTRKKKLVHAFRLYEDEHKDEMQ